MKVSGTFSPDKRQLSLWVIDAESRAAKGSHKFILDYLAEEVLDRQSPELREFLVKASILDRMAGPVCDAILDRRGSQSILKPLEDANLFVLPLDDERRWYRYHPLFADILRSNVSREYPNELHELHHRASQWCARYGMLPEAAKHAFMAGDIAYVAQLVEDNALAIITVFSQHLPVLVGWLNALPEEMLHSRPWLAVAEARALLGVEVR